MESRIFAADVVSGRFELIEVMSQSTTKSRTSKRHNPRAARGDTRLRLSRKAAAPGAPSVVVERELKQGSEQQSGSAQGLQDAHTGQP